MRPENWEGCARAAGVKYRKERMITPTPRLMRVGGHVGYQCEGARGLWAAFPRRDAETQRKTQRKEN